MIKNLEEAEVLWLIGTLTAQELTEFACVALDRGIDSRSLRLLAGLSASEYSEAAGLFNDALDELGRTKLSKETALRFYVRLISEQIVSGEISPEKGARYIWTASVRANIQGFHEADPFIYAASEIESRPEDYEFFSTEIIKEARRWGALPSV